MGQTEWLLHQTGLVRQSKVDVVVSHWISGQCQRFRDYFQCLRQIFRIDDHCFGQRVDQKPIPGGGVGQCGLLDSESYREAIKVIEATALSTAEHLHQEESQPGAELAQLDQSLCQIRGYLTCRRSHWKGTSDYTAWTGWREAIPNIHHLHLVVAESGPVEEMQLGSAWGHTSSIQVDRR